MSPLGSDSDTVYANSHFCFHMFDIISKRNGKNKFLFTGEHLLESIEALHRQLVAVVGIYSTKFGCKHVPGLSNLEA